MGRPFTPKEIAESKSILLVQKSLLTQPGKRNWDLVRSNKLRLTKEHLDKLLIQVLFAKLRYLYCIHSNEEDLAAIQQLHIDVFWLHQRVSDLKLLRLLIWKVIHASKISEGLHQSLVLIRI